MKIMKKFMEKSIRNRLAVTFIGMMVLFFSDDHSDQYVFSGKGLYDQPGKMYPSDL